MLLLAGLWQALPELVDNSIQAMVDKVLLWQPDMARGRAHASASSTTKYYSPDFAVEIHFFVGPNPDMVKLPGWSWCWMHLSPLLPCLLARPDACHPRVLSWSAMLARA